MLFKNLHIPREVGQDLSSCVICAQILHITILVLQWNDGRIRPQILQDT